MPKTSTIDCDGYYHEYTKYISANLNPPAKATITENLFVKKVDCNYISPDGICLASKNKLNPNGSVALEVYCPILRRPTH
jgi:hypothetical protein